MEQKVKQTATKLHRSRPDETDKARNWSLLQMRNSNSGSGPKPVLRGTRLRLYSPGITWEQLPDISCFLSVTTFPHLRVVLSVS